MHVHTDLAGKQVWEYRLFAPLTEASSPSIMLHTFTGSFGELLDHIEETAYVAAERGEAGRLYSLVWLLAEELRGRS